MAIPLFAWNILYMMQYLAKTYIEGSDILPVNELLTKFCLFGYNGFMWFFVPLILIYISLPFFAVFVLNSDRRLLRLFLTMGLILGCIPPLDSTFTTRCGLSDVYIMGSRFLYFIVAGYYIGNFDISRKIRRRLYACSVASGIVMFVGTMCLTLYFPGHYRYFLAYTNIPCAITALGVFTFFKYHEWEKTLASVRLKAADVARYSSFSLGIYLIQGAWFTVIGHFHVSDGNLMMKFVVMYVVCVTSIWIMKHIPVVKKIV